MLNENIKAIRKSKGLSQQELAERLNVVRQTVSKWEQGLSVPDADLLVSISEVLGVPVSTLLGENVTPPADDELKMLSEKLENINLQLARRNTVRRKTLHWFFLATGVLVAAVFVMLLIMQSPYLGWDYSDPETAVFGAGFHAFEYLFVRLAPIVFIGATVGFFLTGKKTGR